MTGTPVSDGPAVVVKAVFGVQQQQIHGADYAIDRTAQSRGPFHLAIRVGLDKVAAGSVVALSGGWLMQSLPVNRLMHQLRSF